MQTTKVEINLEALLKALESDQGNPNCYSETGSIRAKFREYGSDKVVIFGKDIVSITQEECTQY